MASASTSSVQKQFKYDVFLSFRGEDTRKTFVDHLYLALHQRGINTYKDDERIKKGKQISDQLISTIEESRFHIIVFSKNYASSSWCLDELVKIMECQKTKEQTAYLIFFDVEPTEVRNQSGAVGKAFEKHVGKEGACRWRGAMKEAAGLAGRELKSTFDGHEAKFIQMIVQEILLELRSIDSSGDGKLVGIETRVKNVLSSLETGFDDVLMIGIVGMGGGGKTTLARAVYDCISTSFEGKSFVENVREVSKGSSSGLKELQKQVLKDVLNGGIDVPSVSDGGIDVPSVLKVLVVLDDVDDIEQLEVLAGERNWFKAGSRIIITTRDKQVLEAHRVNFIHDVSLLSNKEAMFLFSRYAFRREIPVHGYEELSTKVVHYASGLPLTIKILGSFLCAKTECEWDDVLERLKTIPWKGTLEILEISYNGLENDQKEMFLEVACILKGFEKENAIRILESCGFRARIGLKVLEQKSLLTTSDDGELLMHDHIEEMGMNIVRRLHPEEPGKHSRLRIEKEIEDVLVNDLGTEAIRSIRMDYTELHPARLMKGLKNMTKLRCLFISNDFLNLYDDEEFVEVETCLPNTLQSLNWTRYPFLCLPKTFQANKLVNLEMKHSHIFQLWETGEKKVLQKLRFLNLAFSEKLKKFDLEMTPNLETLDLEGCNDFAELHMPIECGKLKVLRLCGSKVTTLNLRMTPSLEELDLDMCEELVELHMATEYPKLKILRLCNSKVSNLNLVMTPSLEELDLLGCEELVELHMPVECTNLKNLDLSGSKVSILNLGMVPNLKWLELTDCEDFSELHIPVECPNLKHLDLSGSKLSSLNLGHIPNLDHLRLEQCKNLQEIQVTVGCLEKLTFLDLSGCLRFEDFFVAKLFQSPGLDYAATLALSAVSLNTCPLHPNNNLPKFQFKCEYDEPLTSSSGNLEKLLSFGLCACTNLESFSASICGLQHLRKLKLEGNLPEVPRDLYRLESLEKLSLWMNEIKHLPDNICMLRHLKSLDLKYCRLLEHLPNDLDRLEDLKKLDLTSCISLRDIPNSICNMKCLEYICLHNCIRVEKLPEELGRLKCLRELNIEGTGITHLPQSMFRLKNLRVLPISMLGQAIA